MQSRERCHIKCRYACGRLNIGKKCEEGILFQKKILVLFAF